MWQESTPAKSESWESQAPKPTILLLANVDPKMQVVELCSLIRINSSLAAPSPPTIDITQINTSPKNWSFEWQSLVLERWLGRPYKWWLLTQICYGGWWPPGKLVDCRWLWESSRCLGYRWESRRGPRGLQGLWCLSRLAEPGHQPCVFRFRNRPGSRECPMFLDFDAFQQGKMWRLHRLESYREYCISGFSR